MKKIIITVSVLVFFIARLSVQSVDEIVAKNLKATGGVEKLHELTAVITESTIKVQGLVMENLTTVWVGKAMRSESKIMGNTMVQVYDGDTFLQ